MLRTLWTALLTASAALAVPLPDKQPGPPPVPVRVQVDGDKVTVEVPTLVTVLAEEERTFVTIVNGQKVPQTVKVPVKKQLTVVRSVPAGPNAQFFDLGGDLVDTKQLAERIKKAPQILLSADGKPVSPTHLREAQPGTLVLVAPDLKLPAAP